MNDTSREARLSGAFVKLADTLTDDYDVVDLLQTLLEESTAILDTEAGGLMLADAEGNLQLVASTSEQADLVEFMQLNAGVGPCLDCFASGLPVSVPDIAASGEAWPAFRDEALKQGFRSIYATPMKLRGQIIGTMNLLSTRVGELNPRDSEAAQALTDVATIGILQERMVREQEIISDQLQRALDSRILIEQAKGVLSEAASINMDDAFARMRGFARGEGLRLGDVADAIIGRTVSIADLMAATAHLPRRSARKD